MEQMVSDKKIFMGISHWVLCYIKFGCGGHPSETTVPIANKLWWNGPWMAPFPISIL
jgi:hypothetical protein